MEPDSDAAQNGELVMSTDDLSSLKHAQQVLALRIAWHGQQINRQSNHTLDDDLLGESRFILEQLDELEDDIAMLRAVSNVAIRVITGPAALVAPEGARG